MPFNINDFLTNTNQNLMRESQFEVRIDLPNYIKGDTRQMTFLCSAANIPARQVEISTIRRAGQGLLNPYGVGLTYSALDLSFYCDENSQIIATMQNWMDSIMDLKSDYVKGGTAYGIQYAETYDTTVYLTQFSSNGDRIAEYQFFGAFPTSFGPVNFNWASKDQLVIVPVTFTYLYYFMNNIKGQTGTVGGKPPPAPTDTQGPGHQIKESKNNRLPATDARRN